MVRPILALVCCAVLLPAQENGDDPSVVSVVGASVSSGFADPRPRPDGTRNRTIDLARLLREVWPDDQVTVKQRANLAMFLDPVRFGTAMIDRTLRDEPDLVLAVDFMFWFGYGGAALDEERCLAMQAAGLEQLDRIVAPILVGNYPDMRDADPRMLPPNSVPEPATLKKLNERLRAWAAERPRVRLFDLAAWVEAARTDGAVMELGGKRLFATPVKLLQGDRLHATRLGMALLGERICAESRALLPEDHPLKSQAPNLEQFVEAAGVEVEDLKPVGDKEMVGAGKGG